MPKMLMSEVIAMLKNREFSIPVESLTKTQRIGMIEYAYLNDMEILPTVMNLLLSHCYSLEEADYYIKYLFMSIKQKKEIFPIVMLPYKNLKTYFQKKQIERFFQLAKNRIGESRFTNKQLWPIVKATILPNYYRGEDVKQDAYHIQALQVQRQIYKIVQYDFDPAILEDKELLRYWHLLPHQYIDYLNRVKSQVESQEKSKTR